VLVTVRAHAGDYIVNEGEQGDTFFMVMEGELDAYKTLTPGEPA